MARLRGDEVSVVMTRAGIYEDTFTSFLSLNLELTSEIIQQGYLGADSDEVDDVFKGIKGDLEMHTSSPAWIDFVQALHDRQQRRTPDLVFNIAFTMFYPSGATKTGLLEDVKFGAIPITVSARAAYVSHKFTVQCRKLTWS